MGWVLSDELVNGPEECREGLSRAGGGDDQCVLICGDGIPGTELGGGGLRERRGEPGSGCRGKSGEDVVGAAGWLMRCVVWRGSGVGHYPIVACGCVDGNRMTVAISRVRVSV